MKVLLLTIANESNKLYVKLIEIYSLLAKQNIEWLDIYILINDSTLTNILIEDNIIRFPREETPGLNIFQKSIDAINVLDKNDKYDFIIRSNLSTYFHLDGLYNFLKSNEYTNQILCPLELYYSKKHRKSSQKRDDDFNLKFGVGFCIIIPKCLKHQIIGGSILFKDEYKNMPDDVIFGYIFSKLGINTQNIRQHLLTTTNYSLDKINSHKFIFRNRNYIFVNKIQDFDKRYIKEIKIWEEILSYFHNIEF